MDVMFYWVFWTVVCSTATAILDAFCIPYLLPVPFHLALQVLPPCAWLKSIVSTKTAEAGDNGCITGTFMETIQ